MMKLNRIFALVLALAMCLTMGALAEEADKDARIAELEAQVAELEAQVADLTAQLESQNYVAAFDGGYVTVEEAMAEYEYVEYMMSMYGYSVDGYEDYYKNDIAVNMLEDKLVQFKAAELGLNVPSPEQEQELILSAENTLNEYVETYKAEFTVEGADEATILMDTINFLTENGITAESLYHQELTYFAAEQLYEYVVGDIEVTDEELKAEFDALVAADEITYADLYYYESAIMSGYTIYWHPEGYRNVSQVLIKFDDDQQARYDEITDRMATEGITEDELAAANAELDALYAELQPAADEVVAKFSEGVPMEELVYTYGGDPGSLNDDGSVNTYAVSADSVSFDPAFIEAAMSTENIGELSAPTPGMYGLYIVYYDSDVTPGAVDYESVKEELYYTTLETARAEAYDAQIAQWCEELNVVYYLENFR